MEHSFIYGFVDEIEKDGESTTSYDNGHSHSVQIDENGDGFTSEDDGHKHAISDYEVLYADGHTHDLLT